MEGMKESEAGGRKPCECEFAVAVSVSEELAAELEARFAPAFGRRFSMEGLLCAFLRVYVDSFGSWLEGEVGSLGKRTGEVSGE